MKNLEAVGAFLKDSPTGFALLQSARRADVTLQTDAGLAADESYYYASAKRIDLSGPASESEVSEKVIARQLCAVIGGLRRAWHSENIHARQNIMPRPTRDFLCLQRCLDADTAAVTYLIAWEMRAARQGFFWRHLLSHDLRIYDREIYDGERHDRESHDGKICDRGMSDSFVAVAEHTSMDYLLEATRATFLEWFRAPERLQAADRQTLSAIDMVENLSRDPGAPGGGVYARNTADGPRGPGHLRKSGPDLLGTIRGMGLLPSGQNYLSDIYLPAVAYLPPAAPLQQARWQMLQQERV